MSPASEPQDQIITRNHRPRKRGTATPRPGITGERLVLKLFGMGLSSIQVCCLAGGQPAPRPQLTMLVTRQGFYESDLRAWDGTETFRMPSNPTSFPSRLHRIGTLIQTPSDIPGENPTSERTVKEVTEMFGNLLQRPLLTPIGVPEAFRDAAATRTNDHHPLFPKATV